MNPPNRPTQKEKDGGKTRNGSTTQNVPDHTTPGETQKESAESPIPGNGRPSSSASSMSGRKENDNSRRVSDYYTGPAIQASAASHIGDHRHQYRPAYGVNRTWNNENGYYRGGSGRRYSQNRQGPQARPNFSPNFAPRRPGLLPTQIGDGVRFPSLMPPVSLPPPQPYLMVPMIGADGSYVMASTYLNCGCPSCRTVLSGMASLVPQALPCQPYALQAPAPNVMTSNFAQPININAEGHHQLLAQGSVPQATQDVRNTPVNQALGPPGHNQVHSLTPRKPSLGVCPQPLLNTSQMQPGQPTSESNQHPPMSITVNVPASNTRDMASFYYTGVYPQAQNFHQVPSSNFMMPQDPSGNYELNLRQGNQPALYPPVNYQASSGPTYTQGQFVPTVANPNSTPQMHR